MITLEQTYHYINTYINMPCVHVHALIFASIANQNCSQHQRRTEMRPACALEHNCNITGTPHIYAISHCIQRHGPLCCLLGSLVMTMMPEQPSTSHNWATRWNASMRQQSVQHPQKRRGPFLVIFSNWRPPPNTDVDFALKTIKPSHVSCSHRTVPSSNK